MGSWCSRSDASHKVLGLSLGHRKLSGRDSAGKLGGRVQIRVRSQLEGVDREGYDAMGGLSGVQGSGFRV